MTSELNHGRLSNTLVFGVLHNDDLWLIFNRGVKAVVPGVWVSPTVDDIIIDGRSVLRMNRWRLDSVLAALIDVVMMTIAVLFLLLHTFQKDPFSFKARLVVSLLGVYHCLSQPLDLQQVLPLSFPRLDLQLLHCSHLIVVILGTHLALKISQLGIEASQVARSVDSGCWLLLVASFDLDSDLLIDLSTRLLAR